MVEIDATILIIGSVNCILLDSIEIYEVS